jgi:lipopolysaccharide/colanic/teichoic acid biosynthesis glycosyltransferase
LPRRAGAASLADIRLMMSSFKAIVENMLGRLVALIVLITFLPALLLIAFLLRSNSDEPILLTDEVLSTAGNRVNIHRFRTSGRGIVTFRTIGRFLRSVDLDDLPGLWDVLRGQIGLMQFYHLNRKQ